MNGGRLQRVIDVARALSLQRYLLCALTVVAALAATTVITVGSDGASAVPTRLMGLILVLAIGAVVYPDSPAGLAIIAVIAWQWIATVDDVTTPRSVMVAICLVVVHAVLALMAVTPHTTIIDTKVLGRWAGRTAAVSLVTALVWLLVVAFDRLDLAGSPLFTGVALGLLGVGVVALRLVRGATRPGTS